MTWPEAIIVIFLAALMLVISLTFDAHAVKIVFRKPSRQIWALALVYGPMSIAGWLTGESMHLPPAAVHRRPRATGRNVWPNSKSARRASRTQAIGSAPPSP